MFTSDSQHLIYGTGIEAENKYFLMVNGIPQEVYSGLGNVVVANKHVAYFVGDKKRDNLPRRVILDGVEQKEYDFIGDFS